MAQAAVSCKKPFIISAEARNWFRDFNEGLARRLNDNARSQAKACPGNDNRPAGFQSSPGDPGGVQLAKVSKGYVDVESPETLATQELDPDRGHGSQGIGQYAAPGPASHASPTLQSPASRSTPHPDTSPATGSPSDRSNVIPFPVERTRQPGKTYRLDRNATWDRMSLYRRWLPLADACEALGLATIVTVWVDSGEIKAIQAAGKTVKEHVTKALQRVLDEMVAVHPELGEIPYLAVFEPHVHNAIERNRRWFAKSDRFAVDLHGVIRLPLHLHDELRDRLLARLELPGSENRVHVGMIDEGKGGLVGWIGYCFKDPIDPNIEKGVLSGKTPYIASRDITQTARAIHERNVEQRGRDGVLQDLDARFDAARSRIVDAEKYAQTLPGRGSSKHVVASSERKQHGQGLGQHVEQGERGGVLAGLNWGAGRRHQPPVAARRLPEASGDGRLRGAAEASLRGRGHQRREGRGRAAGVPRLDGSSPVPSVLDAVHPAA